MFTIGTDPEFILTDGKKPVSAIGKFPSSSSPTVKHKNKFYYDNVMVEIQVKEARNKKEFITNIGTAIHDLANLSLPYHISNLSSCNFSEDELKHSDSRIIGCNVEYCAYELKIIPQPHNIIKTTGFRSAGGHIHLGSKSLSENGYNIIHAVRLLDLFLGIPSLIIDTKDGSKNRRKIYGMAGSHRLTDYGLEYRSLSNFWLYSPDLCGFIYDVCEFILNFIKEKEYLTLWTIDQKLLETSDDPSKAYICKAFDVDEFRECINTSDIQKSKKYMNIIKKYLPKNIYNQIKPLSKTNYNIKKNWGLI